MLKNLLNTCFILSFSTVLIAGPVVTNKSIQEIEDLVRKHKLDNGLSKKEKYRAYAVLARELELYGHLDKSIEYYNKSIKNLQKSDDPLEVYTSLLSVIYKVDSSKAKMFFEGTFKEKAASSTSSERDEVLKFWKNVFAKEVNDKIHTGFYGQFFKDRDVKNLISKKKYNKAFKLLNPKGLSDQNINKKLEYDVLSKLNGKRNGYFCEAMLERYSKSSSVTMEICRYLKNGRFKYGTLKDLKVRTNKELPHLSYLVEVLEDVK